jgi:hypothetical protein
MMITEKQLRKTQQVGIREFAWRHTDSASGTKLFPVNAKDDFTDVKEIKEIEKLNRDVVRRFKMTDGTDDDLEMISIQFGITIHRIVSILKNQADIEVFPEVKKGARYTAYGREKIVAYAAANGSLKAAEYYGICQATVMKYQREAPVYDR